MEENEKSFKTVQNPDTYKNVYSVETKTKSKIGFGKSVLLPFFSGVVGCGLVLRYLLWSSFNSFYDFKYSFFLFWK